MIPFSKGRYDCFTIKLWILTLLKDSFIRILFLVDFLEASTSCHLIVFFSEKENVPPAFPGLDNNVLAILGFNFEPDIKAAPPIQTEIALAWTNILVNGLKEEERSTLVKKYRPPENCNLLEVPKLNPEVASVIKSFVASRDTKMGELQNQIGTSLAALGQLLSDLLIVNDGNTQHIQLLSDACRLLLDFHHKQSMSRRELVMYDLKNDVKDLLSSSNLDGWLFGEKLGDRLRVSKEVERSGLELKPLRSKVIKRNNLPQQPSKNLNYSRPLRRQGEYQSGRKVTVQNPRSSNNRRHKPQLSYQERKVKRGGVFHQRKENRERM